MADKHTIAQAAKNLNRALSESKEAREAADMPAILNRFKEQIGGTDQIADMLLEDFRKARGDETLKDSSYSRNDTLIQKYHTMLLRAIQTKDESIANAADLSHLDEDDLKATLIGLAREILATDQQLREQLVTEVLQENPQLIQRALGAIGIEVIDDGSKNNKATA